VRSWFSLCSFLLIPAIVLCQETLPTEPTSEMEGATVPQEITQPEHYPPERYALDRPEERGSLYGGFGLFQVSTLLPMIGPINDALEEAGYGTFANPGYALGGMGFGIIHNFIIGGEGNGVIGDRREIGRGYRGSWDSAYGMVQLGYTFQPSERLVLYPLLGIGGGSFSFTFYPVEPGVREFSEALKNPRQGSVITATGPLLGLSLGALYLLGSDPQGGWVISLRAGYLYSPLPWDFQLFSHSLENTPKFRGVSGPFLLVGIGGGGLYTSRGGTSH